VDRPGDACPQVAWKPAPGGSSWGASIAGQPGSGKPPSTAPRAGSGARPAGLEAVANGIQASLLAGAAWHKSSFSGPNGNCVEAAELPAGVAVRNSRFPDGPALVFTEAEWDAFLRGVKGGDFG
jgi:Domain of unknown function (DUF397)